jgi:hypothetical protein
MIRTGVECRESIPDGRHLVMNGVCVKDAAADVISDHAEWVRR